VQEKSGREERERTRRTVLAGVELVCVRHTPQESKKSKQGQATCVMPIATFRTQIPLLHKEVLICQKRF
jgi:hypothetical protein